MLRGTRIWIFEGTTDTLGWGNAKYLGEIYN